MRSLGIRTEGLAEAVAAVARPGERALDLKPAMEASIFHWQSSERRRFRTTRGWKKNTDDWAKRKRAAGLDPRTMRATGRAEAALTNANKGAGALATASSAQLIVGVRRGRSDIYYLRALAKQGYQTVTFDRKAKKATGVTVLHFVTTGRPDV